jgi:hypothetical protein
VFIAKHPDTGQDRMGVAMVGEEFEHDGDGRRPPGSVGSSCTMATAAGRPAAGDH